MGVFDNVRGFVPLPENQNENPKSPESVNGVDIGDLKISSVADISLPNIKSLRKKKGYDTNNSIIDQLYTTLDDISNFIHLPVPESLTNIYKKINRVESIVADPLHEAKRLLSTTLFKIFDPNGPAMNGMMLPSDQSHGKKMNEILAESIRKSLPDVNQYDGVSNAPAYNEFLKDYRAFTGSDGKYFVPDYDDDGNPHIFEFQGRLSVKDLTMRLNHLWDIKIEPYMHRDKNIALGLSSDTMKSSNPIFENGLGPNHMLKRLSSSNHMTSQLKLTDFNREVPMMDYIPVMSYDLNMKTLMSKEIDLYNGSSISVPEVIRYNSHLNLQILDDNNRRWRRWFQAYSEALFDEVTSTVTPYKNSCLLITIYQYKADRRIVSQSSLLCLLRNYQMVSNGAGMGNADLVDLEFSVVGMIDLPPEKSYLKVV